MARPLDRFPRLLIFRCHKIVRVTIQNEARELSHALASEDISDGNGRAIKTSRRHWQLDGHPLTSSTRDIQMRLRE